MAARLTREDGGQTHTKRDVLVALRNGPECGMRISEIAAAIDDDELNVYRKLYAAKSSLIKPDNGPSGKPDIYGGLWRLAVEEVSDDRPTEKRKAMELALAADDERSNPADRPKTRAECEWGPRPCPWVSCRHHMALSVNETGSIRWNVDRRAGDGEAIAAMRHSCALDVAGRGGLTLNEAGDTLGVTRERIRQMVNEALSNMQDSLSSLGDGEFEHARGDTFPSWDAEAAE